MKLDEWKLRCPYGIWTCADGREVLFNRAYWPILERRPGKPAKPANPNEWVEWIEQDYYFDDGNSPWHNGDRDHRSLARINAVLTEWGFPPLPKPPKPQPWKPSRWNHLGNPIPPRRNPYADRSLTCGRVRSEHRGDNDDRGCL